MNHTTNHTTSQISRTCHIDWKKFLSAVMLSAFALAPIVAGSTPAHADRDDWKSQGRHGDYRNRGNDYRNRDNNYRTNSYRENRTYEGTVTNDQPGREFVLRLDNGQRVQVRSEEREPRRLSSGDRVRVQGYFLRTGERDRNNTRYNDNVAFRATNVQIIRNNNNRYDYGNNNRYGNNGGIWGGYNDNRRNLFGVVTDVRSDRRLKVRIDGRDYDVESAYKLNNDIRRGSRVQVNGEMQGNNITRAAVIVNNNGNRYGNNRSNDYYGNDYYGNGYYGNGYYGSSNGKFDFSGRLTDVDERNRTLRLRGDNGRDYLVRVEDRDDMKGVRRGDRVTVRGEMRNGVATAKYVHKD